MTKHLPHRIIRPIFFCCIVVLLSIPGSGWCKDTLRWVFTHYPPANYRAEDGKFNGFFHDIVVDIFEKRLGLSVQMAVFPWKRCQMMVKDGSADMMITVPTPQRLEYAVTHTKPLWTKRRIIYTYRGHPKFDVFNRLNGIAEMRAEQVTVISYLGNGWVESTVQEAGIPVVFAATVEGMYQMLAARRGDVVIEEQSLADPLIRQLKLGDAIVATHGLASTSGFHLLIGKKSPYASMMNRVEQEVEAMRANGDINRILERYGTRP